MEKHIEIGGKEYYFAPTRHIAKVIYEVSPAFLKLYTSGKKPTKDEQMAISLDLFDKVDEIAYCLLKSYEGQEHITKKESDKILRQFEIEYGMLDADNALIDLAMSVFIEGEQGSAKKKINW